MWDIKLKATNEQDKQKLKDTDHSLVVTREKEVEEEVYKSKGGQIYGDRRRFDFGW